MEPSLHIALSVCCVAAFARHASRTGRVLLWLWAAAIAVSTLLTHQHHVVDVITGWARRYQRISSGEWTPTVI